MIADKNNKTLTNFITSTLAGMRHAHHARRDGKSRTPANDNFTSRFFTSLFTRITVWFADTANGIEKFFAGEVHTDKLCVGEACVTEDEFRSLLNGGAAAGASDLGGAEAPSGSSAQEANPDTDTTTDTAGEAASSTQSVSAPANEPIAEEVQAEPEPEPPVELAPTNDSFPVEALPATGTQ